jgi:hypothetical protein
MKLSRLITSLIFGSVAAFVFAYPTSLIIVTYFSTYNGPPGGYKILTEAQATVVTFLFFFLCYLPIASFFVSKYLGKRKK